MSRSSSPFTQLSSTPGARWAAYFLATLATLSLERPAAAQEPASDKPPEAPAAAAPADAAPAATETVPAAPVAPPAVEAPKPAQTPQAPVTEAPELGENERPAFQLRAGHGDRAWSVTLGGFVQADAIFDSTRSYTDSIGTSLVTRSDTYAGRVGRSQFSMRSTRFSLAFEAPVFGGVHPSALFETDFRGNDPETTTEAAHYDNPGIRLRRGYVELGNDYVDVMAGLNYDVFGWATLGQPNQIFLRHTQFRLSHRFGADGPVSLELAAAAVRPAQRDSAMPDAHAGVLLSVNGWRGITNPSNAGIVTQPLSIGVSGVVRKFRVDAFTPPPTQNSNSVSGWGFSLDAFVPVIPARNAEDRGNRLSLTGSFAKGAGIADLLGTGGGAEFPTLPNPAHMSPPPAYTPDIDNGLVSFDTQGVLHTLDWQAIRAGFQYYLPGSGAFVLSGNYAETHSNNVGKLFPRGGAEIELLGRVADTTRLFDASLYWYATPSVRLGIGGVYTQVTYLDGEKPHNLRGTGQVLYYF